MRVKRPALPFGRSGPPRRSRRMGPLARAFRVVSVLALAGILAMGALAFVALLHNVSRNLDRYVVDALKQTLRRDVRISDVDVMRPGRIRVTGLAIAAGKTFQDGVLLSAPETIVQYRLWDMLRGRVDPVGSIASVDVHEPYLYVVRFRNNRFNLQELFPRSRKPPKETPFRGIVRLHDGRVRFVDYAVRDLPAPQTNNIGALDARLDAGAPPLMYLSVRGTGEGPVGAASAEGSIQSNRGAFNLRIRAASNDLPYWARYFARIRGLTVTGGSGDVLVDLWKPRSFQPLNASIYATVAGASGRSTLARTPLEKVNGTMSVQTGRPLAIALNASGTTAGMPINAAGTVFTGAPGRMAMTITARDVTLPALRRVLSGVPNVAWVTPQAPMAARAYVYGPLNRLVAVGDVQVPRARLYNTDLQNVTARIRYQDGVVYLPAVSGADRGETVRAEGQINLRSKAIRMVASVPGLSAAALGVRQLPLTGRVTSRVVVTGTTAAPRTGVLLTVTDGRFRGIPFRRLSGRISLQGRRVWLDNAVAILPGAVVQASGSVNTDGPLRLAVRAAGVELGRLLPAAGYSGITGTGFFQGRVEGTLSQPVIQGNARVFNAAMRGRQLDVVSGGVRWTPQQTRLSNVVVALYPTQGVVNGTATVRPGGGVALDMRARLVAGRVESLLREAGLQPWAQGNVRTTEDIRIGGTLAAPDVRGRLVVTNATVRGYPVDNASARFRYASHLMEVRDVEAVSGVESAAATTRLLAPLLRLRAGRLEAPSPFSVTNIRLDRFPGLGDPYVTLAGTVNITGGAVGGTPSAPRMSARVSVPRLSVNRVEFEDVGATLAYVDNSVRVENLSVRRNGRDVLDVPRLAWNRVSNIVNGDVRVANLPVNDVRTMLLRSGWLFSPAGRSLRNMEQRLPQQPNTAVFHLARAVPDQPEGTLRLGGTLNRISVAGAVALAGLDLGGETLERMRVGGRVTMARTTDGGFQLAGLSIPDDGIHAEAQDMLVTGRVEAVRGAQVSAALDANNVPLALARPFLPERFRAARYALAGDVSVSMKAAGDVERPTLVASVTGRGITVGASRMPFSIRSGTINVANGERGPVISVNRIRVLTGEHAVTVQGALPFSWQPLTVRGDEDINLTADLNEQGLDVLKAVSGGAAGPVESATGRVEAQLRVAGRKTAPNWTGFLRVTDGTVKPRPLTTTLQNINVDLGFDPPNKVVVNQLSVQSSSGAKGRLVVEPGGTVRLVTAEGEQVALVPDLRLALNNFRVEETPNAFGYGERVRGTLQTPDNAPLRIVQGARGPLVRGLVTLVDVEVQPPSTSPPAMPGGRAPSIVPSFDLTLAIGKNVWVRNSLFRIRMDETARLENRSLRIRGDMQQPVVSGRMISSEGAFIYPTARFQVTNAAIGVNYSPAPETGETRSPLSVVADAQARLRTTLNGRSRPVTVYLHLEGPRATVRADADDSAFSSLAPYRITLRSSPSLPERQLVALISREAALQALAQGAAAEDILRQETLNILQASILPEALSGFENRLGQAFGLESLDLEYMPTDRAVTVSAAKRVTDRILLSYTRPLGTATAGEAYTVGLSYEITPSLRLTLQEQKGPFLYGAFSTALPGGDAAVRDTQILLEGSFPF